MKSNNPILGIRKLAMNELVYKLYYRTLKRFKNLREFEESIRFFYFRFGDIEYYLNLKGI